MGRSKGPRGGGGYRAEKKAPLVWSADDNSFRIEQEAAGLSDDNIDSWVTAWEDALDKELPMRVVTEDDPVVCSFADFSHNGLGDRGVRKIVRVFLSRGIPVKVLRFFKNAAADDSAEALAELLKKLPGPVEELHVSHNRLTSRGALALMTAAASASLPAERGAPIWLRLENNWIEWDPVLHELERRQVRWGASETRLSYKGTASGAQCGGRKKKSSASSVEGPARVLVHRSYRHQAGRLDEAKGDLSAVRSTRVQELARKNARYERDELLLLRSLFANAAAGLSDALENDSYNLRCCPVTADEPVPLTELADAALLAAPPPGLELPSASDHSRSTSPLRSQDTTPPKSPQRMKISLEQYLMADLPPASDSGDFFMNAQAAEFVPSTPTKAEAKSWNLLAAEFTPSKSEDDPLLATVDDPSTRVSEPFTSPLATLPYELYSGMLQHEVAAAALMDPTSPLHQLSGAGMLDGYEFDEAAAAALDTDGLVAAATALLGSSALAPSPLSLFDALSHDAHQLNPMAAEFMPTSGAESHSPPAGAKRQESRRAVGCNGSESTSAGAEEQEIDVEEPPPAEETPSCTQS